MAFILFYFILFNHRLGVRTTPWTQLATRLLIKNKSLSLIFNARIVRFVSDADIFIRHLPTADSLSAYYCPSGHAPPSRSHGFFDKGT